MRRAAKMLAQEIAPEIALEVAPHRMNVVAVVLRVVVLHEERGPRDAIVVPGPALEPTGQARGARAAYPAYLGRRPENVNARIWLANTHYALGELAQAEVVLREAARREPESVVVLNNLAQTLSDLGRHEEALPVIEKAAAAGGPFAGAVQKTHETILERLGKKPVQ